LSGALLFATAMPLLVRIAICVACATGILTGLWELILLRGPRAIRALTWSEAGEFTAYVGSDRRATPATLAVGSCRLGLSVLLLWFRTPTGAAAVLIDGAVQDCASFRRLCGRLAAHSRGGSGLSSASTDTIGPKV